MSEKRVHRLPLARPQEIVSHIASFAALHPWLAVTTLYVVLAVVACFGLLREPGTIGHHWDWIIPSDPVGLQKLASTSAYAWQDFSFGSFVSYRYTAALLSYLVGAPGYLGADGSLITKTLIFGTFVCSAASMRWLLKQIISWEGLLVPEGRYASLGALIYSFSPYVYNQIIAGDQLSLIAYACAPLAIGFTCSTFRVTTKPMLFKWATLASIMLAILSVAPQMLIVSIVLGIVLGLRYKLSRNPLAPLVLVIGLTATLCAYWILPVVFGGGSLQAGLATTPVSTSLASLKAFTSPFLTATAAAYPGNFYYHALGSWGRLPFIFAYVVCWIVVILAIRRGDRTLAYLALAYAIASLIPLGGAPVLGPMLLKAFEATLPWSLVFRTPQHLMFVVAVLWPMVICLASARINVLEYRAGLLSAVLTLFAISWGFFWQSNYLGLIGPFAENSAERQTIAIANRQSSLGRALFVPFAGGFYYHPAVFDYFFEGGDEPQVRFYPGLSLAPGFKWTPYRDTETLLKALDELVPLGADSFRIRLLLDISGIDTTILHKIGVSEGGVHVPGFNFGAVRSRFDEMPFLRKLLNAPDRVIWHYDGAVPRIYVPSCVVAVPSESDAYDLLALAEPVRTCSSYAFVPGQSNAEQFVNARDFVGDGRKGSPVDLYPRQKESNTQVEVTGQIIDGDRVASIALGNQAEYAVAIFQMRSVQSKPHHKLSFQAYSSLAENYDLSLLAPNPQNRFQTWITLQPGFTEVDIDPRLVEKVGNPNIERITRLRLANMTPIRKPGILQIAHVFWDKGDTTAKPIRYLLEASNRWDSYYYGSQLVRPLIVDATYPRRYTVIANFAIANKGRFAIFARLQSELNSEGVWASIDGRSLGCHLMPRRLTDLTEDVVPLGATQLEGGPHVLEFRYCGKGSILLTGLLRFIVARVSLKPIFTTGAQFRLIDSAPGRFVIHVNGPENTYVVLSDSYDSRWVAMQNGKALDHQKVNGYANGWLIRDPRAGPIEIVFGPQRTLNAGYAISLVASLLLAAALCLIVFGPRLLGRLPEIAKRG